MEKNVDDVGEAFHCQICLEVVYKPVVEACGHVFCFWCLHKAMSHSGKSHCPVCRNPYHHLPRVCELLHYLLLKVFPQEYEKRAKEVSEWEREMGTFSLQLGTLDSNGQENKVLDFDKEKDTLPLQMGTRDLKAQENEVLDFDKDEDTLPLQMVTRDLNGQASAGTSISESKLRITDALCSHCKELIYRPIILNCGHAFCESCVNHNVFQGTTLTCQVCQVFHPAKLWSVCLELHHFLQSMFPVEYEERAKSIIVQNRQSKEEPPTDEIAEKSSQIEAAIHEHVGCDNCGFFPILGKRYRCKNCMDSMGFDLCETCYQSQAGACIVGRFNQHHKAEHQFEVVAKRRFRGVIFLGGDAGLFI